MPCCFACLFRSFIASTTDLILETAIDIGAAMIATGAVSIFKISEVPLALGKLSHDGIDLP